MNDDVAVRFPLQRDDESVEENNEMASLQIGIGLLFEINDVEWREIVGPVDLSTVEGHMFNEQK